MTDRATLTALLERLEAGDRAFHEFGWAMGDGWTHHVFNAFDGDLTSALALHEAVLPEWAGQADTLGRAVVWNPKKQPTPEANRWTQSTTPARAWLIAIVKALIEETEG